MNISAIAVELEKRSLKCETYKRNILESKFDFLRYRYMYHFHKCAIPFFDLPSLEMVFICCIININDENTSTTVLKIYVCSFVLIDFCRKYRIK